MEDVGGKEDEEPAGVPEDQRRCRRLTLAPSVPPFELASVEDAVDVGPDKVLSDNLKNGRLSSFDLVNADGVSRELLRSSAEWFDADLQAHASSSVASPFGDRWEEDEPSSVIVSLSKIVETMPVTDHGKAKIIARSSSQVTVGSPTALNYSLKSDKMRAAAGGRRGDRWEEDDPSSVIVSLAKIVEAMPVTDHGKAKIIGRSSPQDTTESPTVLNYSLKIDKMKAAAGGRRGFRVKPWRGPLPRARPAPLMVLGDFLPKHLVEHHCCSDQSSKTPQADGWESIGLNTGPCTGVGLSQNSLKERAKTYGRPRIDLHLSRGKRLGKTLASLPLNQPSATKTPVLLGSTVLSTNSCRTKGPSYAEMAARPPPQSGSQRAPPQLHNGGGQQRQTQQQAGRSAPDWNRVRSMTGRNYGRPPVGRGRPGPMIFGQNERRREWRQSNHEERQIGSGGSQRTDQRTEGYATEVPQNQK
jgi:hypothetical protein